MSPLRGRLAVRAALALAATACSACATLGTGQSAQRVELGAAAWSDRSAPLDEEPLRELEVSTDGLRSEVALWRVQRCVLQRVRHQPRREISWRSYPGWAGWIAAGEAAAALAAWQTAERAGLGAGASPWLWTAATAALVAAGVDTLAVAGALPRVQQRPLPSLDEVEQWRVVPCGRAALAGAAFAVHGGRAAWQGVVDASGRATLEWPALPERSFPYQSPLAELSCDGCRRVPVALSAEAAAQLVIARRDLDDLDTWLALHAGPPAAAVQAARQQLLSEHARARQRALRAAQSAFDQGDLAAAAQAVRACQAVARSPAPACDALGRQIDDRFAVQQLQLGRDAVARADWELAEAALYRCSVLDAQRPACAELQQRIAAGRQAQVERQQALDEAARLARARGLGLAAQRACRRWASAACRSAVARCLADDPAQPPCVALARRLAKGRAR